MWRADCAHCSTPFYVRYLSIHGSRRLGGGPGTGRPVEAEGGSQFRIGESGVMLRFLTARRSASLIPSLFKHQLYKESF